MNVTTRPSTPEDAYDLAPRLRKEDVEEVKAACGHTPLEALLEGLKGSEECLSILWDDKVIGMFGVVTMPNKVGAIWLLASDDLPKIRWKFLKQTRPWVSYFMSKFDILTNWADSRNEVHLRWIKWAGFNFTNRRVDMPSGIPFLEFIKIRDNQCATVYPL